MLAACAHNSAPSDKEAFKEPEASSFSVTTKISEEASSLCLSVVLIETRKTEHSSGVDQLSFPKVCIATNDFAEHIVSVWTKDPTPTDKPFPFRNETLPSGEDGLEVRFKLDARPGHAPAANFQVLYRDRKSMREHRWQGTDTMPPNQN